LAKNPPMRRNIRTGSWSAEFASIGRSACEY
jgi:hypothetical protein